MLFIGILWASVGRLSRPFGNVCIRQTKVASVWPEQTEQTKQTSKQSGPITVLYFQPNYHVACQLYIDVLEKKRRKNMKDGFL